MKPNQRFLAGLLACTLTGNCGIPSGCQTQEPEVRHQPHKMLQDPEENIQDNAIEVVAENDTQAQNKCEQIAAQRSDQATIVQCLGCRKRTKTTGKYICTLRIESRPVSPPSTESQP